MRSSNRDCPDTTRLAAYLDGNVTAEVADAMLAHLAGCASCRELAGTVVRDQRESGTSVPAHLQQRAAGMREGKRWVAAGPTRWAAAACAIIAVPLLVLLSQDPQTSVDSPQAPVVHRALENPTPAVEAVQFLAPREGQVVAPGTLVVRWMPVPGSPYYDVRLVTDEGDVVAQARVSEPSWSLPVTTTLRGGAEYYVHVEAYPAGAKPLGSAHLRIRTGT